MAIKDYTYTVSNTDWTDTTYSPWIYNGNYTYTYTYPTTVYMYQVFCPKPRCKGVMWGQLNTTVTCPKCQSRIKLVNEPKPDYEVEVS